jgi:Ca-activated chloride channel family protein
VRDDDGDLRGGLSSDDFSVTEDGQPVDLVDFRGGGAGGELSAALVIDRSGSMEDDDKIDGARDAAAAFVDQMRPGDQATIIPFSSEVEPYSDFTDDQDDLREQIGELRADGGTALYDAIVAGVDALRDQSGRRVLLVLADGQDCSAPFDGCPDDAGSRTSLDEAIAYAEQAGQPVYVVGLGDGDTIDADTLQQIADQSGGRYFYAPDAGDLAELYADVAGAVQQEYRLTYVSPRPFYDGTRRDIQVAVGGVAAGTGYTERHLINVVSSPLVGLVLLLPLAGLLALPEIRRRRAARSAGGAGQTGAAPLAPSLPLAPSIAPSAAPATIVAPAAPATIVASPPARDAGQRCGSCHTQLRPGARFCPRCGATQPVAPAPAAERRAFCDMCGRPLQAGAQRCDSCGEPVARRENVR